MYQLVFNNAALVSIAKYKKSNKPSYNKVMKILEELHLYTRIGIWKPEPLKGFDGNVYSREINKKYRLIYEISDEQIKTFIISAKGHYNDKWIFK